jgi:hypothetical protein
LGPETDEAAQRVTQRHRLAVTRFVARSLVR